MPRKARPSDESSFRGDARARAEAIATKLEEESTTADNLGYEEPKKATHFTTPPSGQTAATTRASSMIDPTEWNLEDSQEPYALKDGTEAQLRIIEVRKATRPDTGVVYYTVRMEVPTEPYSKEITDWLDEPSPGLDAKRLNSARVKMGHFVECFGIDVTRPFEPSEDWPGLEGWAILSLQSSEQYGEQNRVAKYVRGR